MFDVERQYGREDLLCTPPGALFILLLFPAFENSGKSFFP